MPLVALVVGSMIRRGALSLPRDLMSRHASPVMGLAWRKPDLRAGP